MQSYRVLPGNCRLMEQEKVQIDDSPIETSFLLFLATGYFHDVQLWGTWSNSTTFSEITHCTLSSKADLPNYAVKQLISESIGEYCRKDLMHIYNNITLSHVTIDKEVCSSMNSTACLSFFIVNIKNQNAHDLSLLARNNTVTILE